MLTEKCKLQFEEWYEKGIHILDFLTPEPESTMINLKAIEYFNQLPNKMQHSEFICFFDSIGIYITTPIFSYGPLQLGVQFNSKINYHNDGVGYCLFLHTEKKRPIWTSYDSELPVKCFTNRYSANVQAIIEANNMINNNLFKPDRPPT